MSVSSIMPKILGAETYPLSLKLEEKKKMSTLGEVEG